MTPGVVSAHNRRLRLFLAVCLLVIFATQVATDAVVCPDQCRQEATQGADCGSTTSACVFCGAGALLFAADIVMARISGSLPVAEPLVMTPPRSTVNVPDRPPRLA